MKLVKDLTDNKPATNQMSLISDTEEVTKFLELAGKKSILNEHTINCRLTACKNLFSILNEGEDNCDYMLRNLDLLINRFKNKHSNVQASTLKVYKSRLKSSLEDFQAWSKDAIAWEKSVTEKSQALQSREKKTPKGPRSKVLANDAGKPREEVVVSRKTVSAPLGRGEGRKLSFPIRSDFNLEINLPEEGLSSKELLRLNLFLFPYCKDVDGREVTLPPDLRN